MKQNYITFIEQLTRNINRDDYHVKRYFEDRRCPVCYEFEASRALQCCHKLCHTCYDRLSLCPICRTPYNNESDDESYPHIHTPRSTWNYLNHETNDILREVNKPIGAYQPYPEELEDPCSLLNIMLDRDVIFTDDRGWVQADEQYLSDWTTYTRFTIETHHRRELANRIQRIIPLLISHCRYWERLGFPIQMKKLIEWRGY